MEQIVEVSPDGTIQLPLEVLEQIKPQSRFVIATHNGTLVLKPADGTQFFLGNCQHRRMDRRL